MSRKYEGDEHGEREYREPSLKDALMPARPKESDLTPPPGEARHRPRRGGDTAPTLQDALLPEDHRPSPPPPGTRAEPAPPPQVAPWSVQSATAAPAATPASQAGLVIPVIVGMAIVVGVIAVFFLGRASVSGPGATPAPPSSEETGSVAAAGADAADAAPEPVEATPARPSPAFDDPGAMGLAEIQAKGLIIDVHEHIESIEQAPLFLMAMDRLGIQKTSLMGSSKFTLTLNEAYGFTEYDENNEELIKIVKAYPERFEAWPTLDPKDPEKLAKIQDLVARGATGVKLYIGHGYVSKNHTYMFHTVAMDDPGMLPFYAWCEENYLPLMMHVNPFGDKTGFAQEFIAVLTQFPDLKVIAPHFILSSVHSPRLEELLDTFPNLYSDVSFGDSFMPQRIAYMSKHPNRFRRIFESYPDRFMFAADLVMIAGRADDWATTQLQAYLDVLSSASYSSPAIPGGPHKGLQLSDELLSRILFRNYLAFCASRPSGTKITREINWERMNQEPVEREPGQSFPPLPK